MTFFALGVLIIAAIFWSRLILSIRQWNFIIGLPIDVHPAYLVVTGLVFGAAALPLIAGLWLGRRWALTGAHIFVGALVLYYWLDRIILSDSETARSNWPFALGLTIALLVGLGWIVTRPASRQFFSG